jgi:hypothetical protein
MEKRSRLSREIKDESKRVAKHIGADYIVIIALFREGDRVHMIEAGNPPMEYAQLHKHLVTADEVLKESGGGDVSVS